MTETEFPAIGVNIAYLSTIVGFDSVSAKVPKGRIRLTRTHRDGADGRTLLSKIASRRLTPHHRNHSIRGGCSTPCRPHLPKTPAFIRALTPPDHSSRSPYPARLRTKRPLIDVGSQCIRGIPFPAPQQPSIINLQPPPLRPTTARSGPAGYTPSSPPINQCPDPL
jgi:hypothetical protein